MQVTKFNTMFLNGQMFLALDLNLSSAGTTSMKTKQESNSNSNELTLCNNIKNRNIHINLQVCPRLFIMRLKTVIEYSY